jgi:hypothetical protein
VKLNPWKEFEPIVLVFENKKRLISTAHEAAAVLIKDWPGDDGDEYCVAVRTCWEVILGKMDAFELRRALLRAAEEAGIAAIAAVH